MKMTHGLADGQVLQRLGARGAMVRISGECNCEGDDIVATISAGGTPLKSWHQKPVGRIARNRFSVQLSGIPAGGPYRLELRCGARKAAIRSFYVGDVWLLAGQSNMEGVGNMSGAARPHPLIRAFSMRREWRQAAEPLHVIGESPDPCHHGGVQLSREEAARYRATTAKGAGVGLHFAREMLARSGVPQALVCTAHGGTSMAQWDPALADQGGGSLYGSLLLSVRATGQPLRGVLWYQGESDASPATEAEYTGRMRELVAALRRDLRQPALPWVIVQLGRVLNWGAAAAPCWNSIQEQQRRLPEKIRHLETVAAVDLPLDDGIHISSKGYPVLAARMARAADLLAYGNRRETPPPKLRAIIPGSASKAPGAEPGLGIDVVFDHAARGLQSAGEPRGFSLLDGQGRALPIIFKTTLHGNIVRLFLCLRPIGGATLSYGRGTDPCCNITDSRGHALPVFGPLECEKPGALLPFATTWRYSGVVPPARTLKQLHCPDARAFKTELKTGGEDGFINQHDHWVGHPGHAYFWSRIDLPEAMKLQFLMGYDGPFRLWLDGRPFFAALDGTNPCLPDEGAKVAALKPGPHRITIAMDTNGGRAWGFFLRFLRLDVPADALASGRYKSPAYGAI